MHVSSAALCFGLSRLLPYLVQNVPTAAQDGRQAGSVDCQDRAREAEILETNLEFVCLQMVAVGDNFKNPVQSLEARGWREVPKGCRSLGGKCF